MKTIEQFLQENSNFDGFVGIFQPISNAKKDSLAIDDEGVTRVTSAGEEIVGFLPMSFYRNIEFRHASGKNIDLTHIQNDITSPINSDLNICKKPHKVFVADDIFQNLPVTNSEIDFWRENFITQKDVSAIISRAYYDCLLGKHRLNTYYEFAVADEHLEFMLYSLSEYFRERFDDIEMRGKKLSLEAEDNGIPSPFRPQYNVSENKKVFLDTLKKMSVSIGVEIDNERKFISVSFDEFWNKQTNTFKFDSVDDLLSYVYNYKESNRLWDNQELENNQMKVRKQR